MAQDESIILNPKNPLLIVKLQDPTTIEQLLENPPAVLAELLAGWFASGNGFIAAAGCRIVQAAFKGEVFEQFAREFNYLRSKGKIPDNFKEKKYGKKSWVELLTILDEEVPDEDRLEALKAMFYSVNKVNTTDGEKIANYQLFQIAKTLTSGQLLLLKAAEERFRSPDFKAVTGAREWLLSISDRLGHPVLGLIERDEKVLMENGLFTGRQWGDGSGVIDNGGRLTDLAHKFYDNLEQYRRDTNQTESSVA